VKEIKVKQQSQQSRVGTEEDLTTTGRGSMVREINTNISNPINASQAVDYLLSQAFHKKASDIHIGVNQNEVNPTKRYMARMRIYGVLHAIPMDYLYKNYIQIVARFRVLAGLDPSGGGYPEDAQFKVRTKRGGYTVRLSTLPTNVGEELCCRIQEDSDSVPELEKIGMTKETFSRLSNLIYQKSGIIILNGPAGSGKTTTIHSILKRLAKPEVKVVTAEDPVERSIPFVTHVQVNPRTDFAHLARAFMRQDANVIFVGEIRGADSARAAIQLAETGHLVLTTLHTRDSVGVISRLSTFDIHENFIASSLIGSLSQRLVSKLCKYCHVEQHPDNEMIEKLNAISPIPKGTVFYKKGPGCKKCVNGIRGLVPIFELFVVDQALSDMINFAASKAELVRAAKDRGMRTLAQEALIRVYAGLTDIYSVRSFIFGPQY